MIYVCCWLLSKIEFGYAQINYMISLKLAKCQLKFSKA